MPCAHKVRVFGFRHFRGRDFLGALRNAAGGCNITVEDEAVVLARVPEPMLSSSVPSVRDISPWMRPRPMIDVPHVEHWQALWGTVGLGV